MSKERFRWHPDANDVYDGSLYGDTLLGDLPCSAFKKVNGKSFTMNAAGHVLTLAPIPGDIDVFIPWGAPLDGWESNPSLTEIAINSGTLEVISGEPDPVAGIILQIGLEDAVAKVDVKGNLIVRDVNVEGAALPADQGPKPGATINVYAGGTFVVGRGRSTRISGFAGSFDINVHDQGSMDVSAHIVDLAGGTYVVGGDASTTAQSSLKVIAAPASPASPVAESGSLRNGSFSIANYRVSCNAASISLLQGVSMSCASTHMKAQDSASLSIACDSIAFDGVVSGDGNINGHRAEGFENGTVFAVGRGAADITFSSAAGGPAPFDFLSKTQQYPNGLLNFITDEGANKSRFRFLGIGSGFEFSAMLQKGLITVDGMPDNGKKTTWRRETDSADPSKYYFTIYLK